MRLRGEALTRRVWLNDVELKPHFSQQVRNHSPDGFNWGYGGSGPAQLALAVCLEMYSDSTKAKRYYQEFKWTVIASLPQGVDFEIELDELWDFV